MKTRHPFFALGVALFLPAVASALFMGPELIPTDRMLKNTEAFLAKNPDSAEGHYTKARIHYLTFVNRAWLVQGWEGRGTGLPRTAPKWLIAMYGKEPLAPHLLYQFEARRRVAETIDIDEDAKAFWKAVSAEAEKLKEAKWKPEAIEAKDALEQAERAAVSFDKALQLDPKNGLAWLGKASLLEQVAEYLEAESEEVKEGPLAEITPESILELYAKAHEVSREKDLGLEFLPPTGLVSLTSHEAATALIRLAGEHPEAAAKVDGLKIEDVEEDLKKLKKLKMGAITPMVLSIRAGQPVEELVREDYRVRFDVDGDGRKETLDSWPAAGAGILVWDPEGRGRVTSGIQWFGTFGFRMLWSDGYRALDAFDDSRDGWLEGAELRGMALWFDRDGDAESDPGEVIGLKSAGVAAIAVNPEEGEALKNSRGVRMEDGRWAPSYDWVFELLE